MKKIARRIATVTACLLVLAVCALVGLSYVAKRERDAAVARLKVPASAEFFKELAAVAGNIEASTTSGVAADTTPLEPEMAQAKECVEAFQDLFELKDERLKNNSDWPEIVDHLSLEPAKWTEIQWRQLERFIDANQDLLREVRRVAGLGGPMAVYEYKWPFDVGIEHLSHARDLARLLRADALFQGQGGNTGIVVDDVVAVFGVCDALAQEPAVTSHLERMSLGNQASNVVRDVLPVGGLSREQTLRLTGHAARNLHHQAFADAFLAEANVNTEFFDLLRGDPRGTADLEYWLYQNPLGQMVLNADERVYAEHGRRFAEAMSHPFYEAEPLLQTLLEDIQDVPFYCRQSAFILPMEKLSTVGLASAQARYEATLDLMRLGFLLELHHAEIGEYPAGLEAIAPDLGGDLPVDPFTGEAYRYVPSGDGFVLYSPGENQTDEGGVMGSGPSEGDLVWRGRFKKKVAG